MNHETLEKDILHREREWQNQVGRQLQQDVAERPGSRLVLERQYDRMVETLGLNKGCRVLDIGCGTGTLLLWLTNSRDINAFGIDLSVTSLLQGQKGGLRKMICGNAEELPIKDSSFSYILCKGSLHHFRRADLAVRNMYRVLLPGGRVVFYEPMATPLTSFVRRVFMRTGRYESPVDLLQKEEFTVERYRMLLTDAGFSNIHISFHDVLAYPLSGGYMGGLLSRSTGMMRMVMKIEERLERMRVLRGVMDLLSWRSLVRASKPGKQ